MVIADTSPEAYNLSLGGATSWTGWFVPYFVLGSAHPKIEWFTYVNYDWTQAAYSTSQEWLNNDISVNASLTALYATEIGTMTYLHSGERALLKDYGKYK